MSANVLKSLGAISAQTCGKHINCTDPLYQI